MSDDAPPITDAQRRRNEATYHLALGRFVDAFARLETLLRMVLFRYARTPGQIGPAVFSGARTAVIQGYLRRLAEVNAIGPEQWAVLEPVVRQLTIIADKRNDILHYGGQAVGTGQGFVTNAMTALTESRKTVFPISAPILTHMTFDAKRSSCIYSSTIWGFGKRCPFSTRRTNAFCKTHGNINRHHQIRAVRVLAIRLKGRHPRLNHSGGDFFLIASNRSVAFAGNVYHR
jgi:hypothetical protein